MCSTASISIRTAEVSKHSGAKAEYLCSYGETRLWSGPNVSQQENDDGRRETFGSIMKDTNGSPDFVSPLSVKLMSLMFNP